MQQFGALDETYTTFPHISSLTRTDCRNSKLFKKIQFEKDIHFFFSISESLQENKNPKVIFWKEGILPLILAWKKD